MSKPDYNRNAYSLDRSIADRLLENQGEQTFVRDVSEQTEVVSYPPGSTVRFWYNNRLESYPPHRHSACEMILPVEGSYLVELGSHTYELAPGDIFLIPGGRLHALHAPSRGSRMILLFEMGPILELNGMEPLKACLSDILLINRSTCPDIYDAQTAVIDNILRAQLRDDSLREMAIYLQLMTFFLNYCRKMTPQKSRETVTDGSVSTARNPAEKFQAVLAYIDRHFDEDLTLAHAADVAGFSKYHFCRMFRQLYGCNFYEYLLRRRIRAAEEFLTGSDLSVSQIALQSGFSSIATFNRTFQKQNQCTPSQYRAQARISSRILMQKEKQS